MKDDKCDTETNSGMDADYQQNMTDGKRSLLCGDYSVAVAHFQDACSQQSEKFGDTSHECAEVFYYYGRSLFELARLENGVFGNALKEGAQTQENCSESDNETDNAETTSVQKEGAAGSSSHFSTGNTATETGGSSEAAGTSGHSEKAEAAAEAESGSEAAGDAPSSSKVAAEEADDEATDDLEEEDVSNMQLAWEMLELAKVLYKKKPEGEETLIMIAQCNQKLGDLSLEMEHYEQAVDDYMECLSIFKAVLPAHDRRLAANHYSLGLAHSFSKQFDASVAHYNSSLAVLEKCIGRLKDADSGNEEEIGEIEELIPDIKSKIEDVLLSKKQQAMLHASLLLKASSSSGAASSSSTTAASSLSRVADVATKSPFDVPEQDADGSSVAQPAKSSASIVGAKKLAAAPTDISHLMRRKRPSPEEAAITSSANGSSSATAGGDAATISMAKKIKLTTETT